MLFFVKYRLLLLSRFSRVRLCNPIDSSPSGSPVPGILQARTLERVATSFSNAWKWKVNVKSLSHVRLLATPWTTAFQAPPSMGFSRQEYWSGVPLPSTIFIYVNVSKSVLLGKGSLSPVLSPSNPISRMLPESLSKNTYITLSMLESFSMALSPSREKNPNVHKTPHV